MKQNDMKEMMNVIEELKSQIEHLPPQEAIEAIQQQGKWEGARKLVMDYVTSIVRETVDDLSVLRKLVDPTPIVFDEIVEKGFKRTETYVVITDTGAEIKPNFETNIIPTITIPGIGTVHTLDFLNEQRGVAQVLEALATDTGKRLAAKENSLLINLLTTGVPHWQWLDSGVNEIENVDGHSTLIVSSSACDHIVDWFSSSDSDVWANTDTIETPSMPKHRALFITGDPTRHLFAPIRQDVTVIPCTVNDPTKVQVVAFEEMGMTYENRASSLYGVYCGHRKRPVPGLEQNEKEKREILYKMEEYGPRRVTEDELEQLRSE